MIVVLAPDSFKGSLSAVDVGKAYATGLRRVWPAVELRVCPMADGGEGTLDVVLSATGGVAQRVDVRGASGHTRQAEWGVCQPPAASEPVGLIEVAQAVPLTDVAGLRLPIDERNSFGVGQLIREALDQGMHHLALALGGSSTNDAGAGMLAALGARWLDANAVVLEPTPKALQAAQSIDISGLDARLAGLRIDILSDVTNPLCGPRGATRVFGPQKGLRAENAEALDALLARLASLCETAFGKSVAGLPGSGAAGGLGFALRLLGGTMRSGAEVVAELNGLAGALTGADWLITGEGRSDTQTLGGKAPAVAAQMACNAGVPVTLLSGSIERSALPALSGLFNRGCFSPLIGPDTLENAMQHGESWLADAAEQIARAAWDR